MSINLTVVIDNDEAIKKFRELQKAAKTTTTEVVSDSERMDMAIRKFGSALASLGVGFSLTELARQVATVRGEFQQLEVAFSTMLGSKAEADALMERVVKLAATTPFDLQGVANGAKQLLAYGSTASDVGDEIKMLGDIAAGMSLPLSDLVYLYGTTRTQGRLFTRDLMQFTGRGIPLMEELAKQFEVSKDQVSKLVTEGKVGFAEVEKAMKAMTSEGGKFNNLMEAQSKTITGQMSNLGDSIQQMFNDIGKESEGAISMAIGTASTLVENYEKVGKIILDLIAAYGAYKTAIMLVNAVSKTRAVFLATETSATIAATVANKGLAQALTMVANAIKASNLAKLANPYTLAAAAIAALIFGIYKLITAKSAEEKAQEKVNAKMEEYRKLLDEEKNKATQAATSMKDANLSAIERVRAYNTLISVYPELLQKYDEEKIKLMELADLNRELGEINTKRAEDELKKQKEDLQKKINERNEEYGYVIDGKQYYKDDHISERKIKRWEEEVAAIDSKLAQIAQEREQAAFDLLPDEEKAKRYQSQLDVVNDKINQYISLLEQADAVRAKEIEGELESLRAKRDDLQSRMNTLNANIKKDQTPQGVSGEDEIKATATAREKAQQEANKAELELQKAHLADKAMLLQLEKDEEVKAIEERIKATSDAEEKAYLEKALNAKKKLYDKQIEDAMNENAPLLFSPFESIFSADQRDNFFKMDIDPSKALRESAEENIPAIEALFGDMRNVTADELNAIADEAEKMLNTFDDPKTIAALRKRIDKLRGMADGLEELDSPLDKLKSGFKALFEFKPNTEGFAQGLADIRAGLEGMRDAVVFVDDVLESLGAGEALDGVVDGFNAAIDAFDAAKAGAEFGSAFGGVGAAIGGALGDVGSLVKSISQIQDKKNEKQIERLQEQIDELEHSYQKLDYAISKAYSVDASELIEQQNKLLEQQKKLIEQQIAEEEDKKNPNDDRLWEWQKELDSINQTIEENVAKINESLTGVSFDSFRDSFLDAMTDMSMTSEDFAKNFEKMLQQAILNALITQKYEDRIKALYDSFADSMEDGKISDAEMERLRAEKDAIYNDMMQDRKAMADVYGWTNESDTGTTSSSGKGFQAMSQETGSELNGRFTDIQGKVTELRSYVMELMAMGKLQYAETVNIRDIMIQINGNVADISAYTKVLPEMRDSINSMNKKLDNL